jgi:eukaryotic-like serine/threonine-protein kinase
MAPSADRNLLFGVLALQMDFIARDDLIAAMNRWILAKHRTLAELLEEEGALAPADRALLEPLVERHIEQHGGNASQSLASLSSVEWIRPALAPIAGLDSDVQATLDRFSNRGSERVHEDGSTAPHPALAPAEGARYRIVRLHAKGGLGEVFVARDVELHRDVAVKQIQDRHCDRPESRSRFLLEAEITGGLEHPGIVPVYGLGHAEDGRPFYAMRFIKGDSLKEAIEHFHHGDAAKSTPGERTLELQKLLRRFLDVCNAIAYAHSRGVLHRDIKPGNIMVGHYGETLVVDWGMAKVVGTREGAPEETLRPPSASGSSETLPGAAIGTPAYMSPEQAAGRLDELGPASDVYSLGATLYCLLTGRPPIEGAGGDVEAVLERTRRGEFRRPRQIKPETPRALEAICMKAMATKQFDRYSSPRELADDVERWLADEPVSAWREPAAMRVRRFMRRYRTAVTGAAATILVALVALAITYRREVAANRALRLAKAESDRRLDQTLEAIADYYTGVNQELLLSQKEFQPLREKLLEKPRAFYEKMTRELASGPVADEHGRLLLARGRLGLGQILSSLGHHVEAQQHWREAIAIYDWLRAKHPDSEAYREALAACHNNLGAALGATGNHREAIGEFHRVSNLLEGSVKARPNSLLYQQKVLAGSYNALGRALHDTGDMHGAIAAHRRAIELFEPLAAAQPGVVEFQDLLARSQHGLAVDLLGIGDHKGAIVALRQTIKLYDAVLAAQPSLLKIRGFLGSAHSTLGIELLATGETDSAIEAHRRAIEFNRSLAEAEPNAPQYQALLAHTHVSLGAALLHSGNRPGAIKAHRQAIDLYRALQSSHPDVPDYQHGLAQAERELGGVLDTAGQFSDAVAAVRRAIKIYEALTAAHPNVPRYLNSLGLTYLALGNSLIGTGDIRGAVDAYRQAIKSRTALVEGWPEVPDYRAGLASGYAGLANVLSGTGDVRGAIQSSRRAVELYQALVAAHGKVTRYQSGLANASLNLAIALIRLGDNRGAITECRRASDLYRALAKAEPNVPDYKFQLSQTMSTEAVPLLNTGDVKGAIEVSRQAIEQLEETLAAQPNMPTYQPTLASSLNRLGNLLLNTGDGPAALEAYRKGIKICESLLKSGPGIPEYRNGLAASLANLGLALNQMKREAEAVSPLRTAIEHARIAFAALPQVSDCRVTLQNAYKGLAEALRGLGKVTEAAEATRERIKVSGNRPDALHDAACELAVCSASLNDESAGTKKQKDQLAADAVQALRAAIAAGWKDAGHTWRDPDLRVLHDRADFQQLIGDLFDRAFPAKPFAP